jgi:cytochrome c1
MHKKAQLGEQIMVFMFIFLMFVIGAGIVLGTYFFIGP